MKEASFLIFRRAYHNLHLFTQKGFVGLVWYLFDPLVIFFIFIFLGKLVLFIDAPYYPLYLFIGISIFNLFRKSTVSFLHAIRDKKIEKRENNKLPIIVYVAQRVLHVFLLHFAEIIIFILLLNYYDISLLNILIYLPVLVVMYIIFASMAIVLTFIASHWTNTMQAWISFLRLLFLATPVFYILPNDTILDYNPLVYIINVGRSTLMEGVLYSTSGLITLGIMAIGVLVAYILVKNKKLI